MGLIHAMKLDKVPVGEGVVIKGEIVAADPFALERFTKGFLRFLSDWRDRGSEDQIEIELSAELTLVATRLRADQPKLEDKHFSIGIDLEDVSFDDRSHIFNISQDDREIFVTFAQGKRRTVTTTEQTTETQLSLETPAPTDSGEVEMVERTVGDLILPAYAKNSLEERLQLALLLREGSGERWMQRMAAGMTDKDLSKAVKSEWEGEFYEAPDDGCHFIVQGGNKPRFRLADNICVRVQINNKPTLEGKKLLGKVREVLGIPEPTTKPKSPTKSKGKKAA